jgi:hypothetical protein
LFSKKPIPPNINAPTSGKTISIDRKLSNKTKSGGGFVGAEIARIGNISTGRMDAAHAYTIFPLFSGFL